jgi:organic radical activating enzyme
MMTIMDDGLLQFRNSILNSKSASFCGAKWGNSTLWLNSGETSSCHLPPVHKIDPEQILLDPAKLHNTDHKSKMRQLMKDGHKPSECDYCWKIESMGTDYISDRVFKSLQFKPEEMQEWFDKPADARIIPPTLEVMFDRTCNFACSYCNANFSTTWERDIKKHGNYDLETSGGGAFKHDGTTNNCHEKTENPYIKAFWEWWPELSKELRTLRVTGGEPLMSTDVWKLIDLFAEEKYLFELGINSNLGAKKSIIDRLIERSHDINNLTLFTSMETTGAQAEYIRDGLDYESWCNNIERILGESNVKRIVVMMTINALCLFNITEIMDQIMVWKRQYGNRISMSINFLRFPAFQSLTVLPDSIRETAYNNLSVWFQKNKDNPDLMFTEKSDVERLISYVNIIETPHSYDTDLEKNRKDFKKFYTQYSYRRNKPIDVFPQEFLQWFNTL